MRAILIFKVIILSGKSLQKTIFEEFKKGDQLLQMTYFHNFDGAQYFTLKIIKNQRPRHFYTHQVGVEANFIHP